MPVFAFAPQEWFATAQSRSMGMATTAIVNDFNSIYVNPAGLAQIKEGEGELRLPQIINFGMSGSFFDLVDTLKDVTSSGDQTISQQLQAVDGTNTGVDFSFLDGYWTRHRFGIAVNPLGVQSSARVRTPSLLFAKVDLFAVIQGGVAISYGHPFLNNHLRVGLTWKPVMYRSGLIAELENQSIVTLTDNFSDYAGTGLGMDFDIGAQYSFPEIDIAGDSQLSISSGVAAQNLLATNFPMALIGGQTSTPPAMVRRYNFGVAAVLKNPGIIEPTLSLELRDLGTGYDELGEKFHAAIQLKMTPRDFYTTYVRFHIAKGNFGGGLGFRWSVFEFEAGTYAENLGPGPGVGADRRYYGQGALTW